MDEQLEAQEGGQDELSLSQLWEAAEPDSRVSKGIFSIWKAPDGALVLAFQLEGDTENRVMPIPAMMLRMAFAAMEGKGPLGHLKNLAERQAARYGE